MALITTQRRQGVLLVGLDRPDKHNAFDEALVEEIEDLLRSAQRGEPAVLVIHSTTPGIFVSGADVAELIERDADAALRAINAGLFERIAAYRWPTIAAIDGPAFGGGCELGLACDFRLCTPRARFAQPELNLGILAGAGGNWRLRELVGPALARRMLYAGEIVDAAEALAAGLVDTVHEPERLLDEAIAYATTIAKRSWRALELTKLAMRQHEAATTLYDITAQALLFDSDDKQQRMQAFLDRRSTR